MHVSNLFTNAPMVRLAERLVERSFGAQRVLRQLGRRGQRGGAEARAQGAAEGRRRRACTARSTGAPTARCRRRRRSPSRRRSRRWCPASAPSSRPPRRSPATVDEHTAAVLLEPVQGESGVHPLGARGAAPPRARRATAVGAALVFDEVQCGVGRTGSLWAYEQAGVVPDAMTLAKGLGGGMPIGALVIGPSARPASSSPATTAPPSPAARSPRPPPTRCSTSSTTRPSSPACTSAASGSPRACKELPGVTDVRARGLMVAADIAADAPDDRPPRPARAAPRHQRHRPRARCASCRR